MHLDGADSRQLTGEVASASKSFKSKSKSKLKSTAAAGRIRCVRDAQNLLSAEDCAVGINVHMVGGFQTHRTTAEEWEAEEAEERVAAAAASSQSSSSAAAAAASLIDAADADADADIHRGQSDGLLLVADILSLLHLCSTASSPLAARSRTSRPLAANTVRRSLHTYTGRPEKARCGVLHPVCALPHPLLPL